ncbi:MAG: hypothetical protein ABW133_06565 [Polyangiaceae bacterium]
MILGQILFLLAALSIAGASVVGIGFTVVKLVADKIMGHPIGPKPTIGSADWREQQKGGQVDLSRRSILSERYGRTTDDPVVVMEGDRYRVTRMAGGRFLITQVGEGRRIGTFELSGEGRHQEIVPAPDDPANADLLVQIAVLSSFVPREAGRVATPADHDGDGRNDAPSAHEH